MFESIKESKKLTRYGYKNDNPEQQLHQQKCKRVGESLFLFLISFCIGILIAINLPIFNNKLIPNFEFDNTSVISWNILSHIQFPDIPQLNITNKHSLDTKTTLNQYPLFIESKKYRSYLSTKIQAITQKETNVDIFTTKKFIGPYKFNLKYPNNNKNYETNIKKRWCFNIKLNKNKEIKRAEIKIIFNKFLLEKSFDKLIIRHYNDSFIDMPIVINGKGNNNNVSIETMHYFMNENTNKIICIELQSDENITNKGIDIDILIRYDLCLWNKWSPCYKLDTRNMLWERGPFSNGKCGIGITKQIRTNDYIDFGIIDNNKGYVNCYDEGKIISPIEYCTKALCEHWSNENDIDFPPKKLPNFAWYNISRYYNSKNRLDPYYANVFRIYQSINEKQLNIDNLILNLVNKKNEIINEHYNNENILKYMTLHDSGNNILTNEIIGAKVIYSLLIGKPFIVGTTGDSVTSGHDNEFASTYSIQLQTRLRHFWVKNGVKGSSFSVRNIAFGGTGGNGHKQSYAPIILGTENYDMFSPLNLDIDNNIIKEYDLLTWSFFFTDGIGTVSQRETHLREAILLNAIWGIVNPTPSITIKDSCKSLKELNLHLRNWKDESDKYGFDEFINQYIGKVGLLINDPSYGLHAACDFLVKGTIKNNGKYGDDGEVPEGQLYGYDNYHLRMNWHPNALGHRVMADSYSYWILDNAITFLTQNKNIIKNYLQNNKINLLKQFLFEKSRNDIRYNLINSIKSNNENAFIKPKLCGKNGDKWCQTIPFHLTSFGPKIYNTHFKLEDYLFYPETINELSNVGWTFKKEGQIRTLEEKEGGSYNLDAMWYFSYNKNFNQNIASEEELVSNKYYIEFLIKVPMYGNGIIHVQECSSSFIAYVRRINTDTLIRCNEDCICDGLNPGKYIVRFMANLTDSAIPKIAYLTGK